MIIDTLIEQMQKTDWIEHLITCFSVFIGAFLAYRFNMAIEWKKIKRQMRGDFCSLATQTHINFINMVAYKNSYLDKMKEDIDKNNVTTAVRAKNYSGISFSVDVDKYVFLNDCNRCLLPELKMIKMLDTQINDLWMEHTKMCANILPALQKKDSGAILALKTSFLQIYEFYNKFCIRMYYLNKHLTQCYERFFNVYYFDDMDEDFQAEMDLIKSIPNALDDDFFIKMDEDFNKYWAPDYTLWERIKYHYRKLKYSLKGLKIYFFGRGKTK